LFDCTVRWVGHGAQYTEDDAPPAPPPAPTPAPTDEEGGASAEGENGDRWGESRRKSSFKDEAASAVKGLRRALSFNKDSAGAVADDVPSPTRRQNSLKIDTGGRGLSFFSPRKGKDGGKGEGKDGRKEGNDDGKDDDDGAPPRIGLLRAGSEWDAPPTARAEPVTTGALAALAESASEPETPLSAREHPAVILGKLAALRGELETLAVAEQKTSPSLAAEAWWDEERGHKWLRERQGIELREAVAEAGALVEDAVSARGVWEERTEASLVLAEEVDQYRSTLASLAPNLMSAAQAAAAAAEAAGASLPSLSESLSPAGTQPVSQPESPQDGTSHRAPGGTPGDEAEGNHLSPWDISRRKTPVSPAAVTVASPEEPFSPWKEPDTVDWATPLAPTEARLTACRPCHPSVHFCFLCWCGS